MRVLGILHNQKTTGIDLMQMAVYPGHLDSHQGIITMLFFVFKAEGMTDISSKLAM